MSSNEPCPPTTLLYIAHTQDISALEGSTPACPAAFRQARHMITAASLNMPNSQQVS